MAPAELPYRPASHGPVHELSPLPPVPYRPAGHCVPEGAELEEPSGQ